VTSKFKLIARSSSFRVFQTIGTIIIGFLMMPFLIRTLGEDLYGLWIVIGSVVGTYYLLDLGFSQAVTRYVTKFIHQNNPDGANRIINTALVIYSALGIVVLFASMAAARYGAESLMDGSENLSLAQTILILTGLAFALEFPSKAFPGIVSAYMRYDFLAIVRLCKSVIDALLIFLFLSNGYGLVAMALITLATGLVSTSIFIWFTTSLFKEIRFSKSLIDMSTFKEVFNFSKWVFLFDINTMIKGKMDIWFIAFFHSSTAVTIYYVSVRLTEYALTFLSQATGITGPIFTEHYAKDEVKQLRRSVVAFLKIDILLGSVFLSGFILLGEDFILLWMGESFDSRQAYICLIILALGRFTVYFSSPLHSLLMTINKHNLSAWVSLGETVLSLILCWLLIPNYSIAGAAIAISFPYLIGRIIIIPLLTARQMELPLLHLAIRISMFTILTLSLLWVSEQFYFSTATPSLALLTIFAPIIAVIQLIVGGTLFNNEELQWIRQTLSNNIRFFRKSGIPKDA